MIAHTCILSIIDSVIPDLVAGLMADGVQPLHLYLALDTPSHALLVCPVLQRLPHAVKDKDCVDTPQPDYTHGRFFAVGLLAMIYEGLDIHLGGTCEAGSEVDCSPSS